MTKKDDTKDALDASSARWSAYNQAGKIEGLGTALTIVMKAAGNQTEILRDLLGALRRYGKDGLAEARRRLDDSEIHPGIIAGVDAMLTDLEKNL